MLVLGGARWLFFQIFGVENRLKPSPHRTVEQHSSPTDKTVKRPQVFITPKTRLSSPTWSLLDYRCRCTQWQCVAHWHHPPDWSKNFTQWIVWGPPKHCAKPVETVQVKFCLVHGPFIKKIWYTQILTRLFGNPPMDRLQLYKSVQWLGAGISWCHFTGHWQWNSWDADQPFRLTVKLPKLPKQTNR